MAMNWWSVKLLLALITSILIGNLAFASESIPLPGTPGSAVPPSQTPGTSLPSSTPVPQVVPEQKLSAPRPQGSPGMIIPQAPPAFSPELMDMEEHLSERHSLRGRILGRHKAHTVDTNPSTSTTASQANNQSTTGARTTSSTPTATGAAQGTQSTASSVESFFQIPGKSNVTPSIDGTGGATLHGPIMNATQRGSADDQEESRKFHIGKALYHVLDNVGVPLPYDKGEALAPDLRSQPAELSVVAQKAPNKNSTATVPAQSQPAQGPNQAGSAAKIPESELEGVELPTPRDETKITP